MSQHYLFHDILDRIANSHFDMREFISNMYNMVSPEIRDVEFRMYDGTTYVIPNFAKMREDLVMGVVPAVPDTIPRRDKDGSLFASFFRTRRNNNVHHAELNDTTLTFRLTDSPAVTTGLNSTNVWASRLYSSTTSFMWRLHQGGVNGNNHQWAHTAIHAYGTNWKIDAYGVSGGVGDNAWSYGADRHQVLDQVIALHNLDTVGASVNATTLTRRIKLGVRKEDSECVDDKFCRVTSINSTLTTTILYDNQFRLAGYNNNTLYPNNAYDNCTVIDIPVRSFGRNHNQFYSLLYDGQYTPTHLLITPYDFATEPIRLHIRTLLMPVIDWAQLSFESHAYMRFTIDATGSGAFSWWENRLPAVNKPCSIYLICNATSIHPDF